MTSKSSILLELKNGEGKLALAMAILLGLSPEEIDKVIKASRTVDLEDEEEEEA